MKRSTIITVAALIIILFILSLIPLLDGIYFKRHYLALIDNINRLETQAKIQLDYKQGWFSSQASVKIISIIPDEADFTLPITIEQTIHHGPLVKDELQNQYVFAIASIKNTLHVPDPVEKFILSGKEASSGILQIHSIAHFNGDYLSKIRTPIFTFSFAGLGNLTWEGIKGEVDLKVANDMIQKVQSSVTVGQLTAESDASSPMTHMVLKVQPITISGNASREPIGLWTGNSDIAIPSIVIHRAEQLIGSLTNLTLNYNININANNYNISEKIILQKLEIPEVFISPISPANFNLAANNFNVQAIIDLLSYARSESTNIFSDEAKKQRYFSLLAKTISSNSAITSDLSATTAQGALNINGKISWPTPPSSLEQIFQYLGKLNIKLSATLLEAIIEEYYVPPAPPATEVKTTGPSTQETFNRKIAELMQEGKLTVPVSMELIDMSDNQSSVAEFNAKLNSLNLAPETVAIIAQAYTQKNTEEIKKAALPAQPVDPKKTMIDNWLKQGYIIQDNNDYTAEFTYEGGVLKINGKIPPKDLFDLPEKPTPLQQGPKPLTPIEHNVPVPIVYPAPADGARI